MADAARGRRYAGERPTKCSPVPLPAARENVTGFPSTLNDTAAGFPSRNVNVLPVIGCDCPERSVPLNNAVPWGSRASTQQSPDVVCTRRVYGDFAIVNAEPDASLAVTRGRVVVVVAGAVVVVGCVAGGRVLVVGDARLLPLLPCWVATIAPVTTVATAMRAIASCHRARGAIEGRDLVVAVFPAVRVEPVLSDRMASPVRARDAASCTALSVRRCRSTDCSIVNRRPKNARRSMKMTSPTTTAINKGKCSFSPTRQDPGSREDVVMTRPEFDVASLNALSPGRFPGLIGFEVTEVERGLVRARLEVEERLLAPNGFLHAAVVVGLADTACGYGCRTCLPDDATGFTTIELKTNFLRTLTAGALACEARLVHGGRTTQVWDARVFRVDDDATVALFRCTQLVLREP